VTPRETTTGIDDWVAETPESIAARLDGAKSSQAQTRLTIGTMALISVMMLIAAYNAYLSYDYGWILQTRDKTLADTRPSEILTQQALKDWASSRTVQISLLGIRVSVDDAAVLGSAVLLVLSLWLLLVARRENHTIGSLLSDTDTPAGTSVGQRPQIYSAGQRWLILQTILANSMFVTCDPSLAVIDSLDRSGAKPKTVKASLSRAGFVFARGFFFMFPPAVALYVFGLDRLSYWIPDPFQENFDLPPTGPFYYSSMIVFVLCWLPLLICCSRSSAYSRATETLLHEYSDRLNEDLLKRQSAPTTTPR
jgi:hypothetical protein